MATHSNILAWKIPWPEEPGRLPSIGSQRVKHDQAYTHTHTHTQIHILDPLGPSYLLKTGWDRPASCLSYKIFELFEIVLYCRGKTLRNVIPVI